MAGERATIRALSRTPPRSEGKRRDEFRPVIFDAVDEWRDLPEFEQVIRRRGKQTGRLRQQLASARVMLVAFTGYGSDEDKLRALAAGFDHHLVKPVDPAKLRRLLLLGREDRPSPLLH